jgi:hypothetical protein
MLGTLRSDHALTHCAGKKEAITLLALFPVQKEKCSVYVVLSCA